MEHSKQFKHKGKYQKNIDKINRAQQIDNEITELEQRISVETPPSGYYYSQHIQEEINLTDEAWKKPKKLFKEFPLSKKTLRGLAETKFNQTTPIQKSSLPHALAGRDILGASKTGSGKTLCFIIPVLEHLYRNKWTNLDGLGALIILPIRELAIQVFEVIKLVGKYHDFSVGLAIGGNDMDREKEQIYNMNIIIGTPGRLSQHLSETAYLNTDNLKVLVIDEADRILDQGFEDSLNEILSYLPADKLTLLFSATLTKTLKRLARIAMKTPEYINLNNTDSVLNAEESTQDKINIAINPEGTKNPENVSITPKNLNQYYTRAESHEKLEILFSFLQSHKTSKCLVFLSSCKQVRYYYEMFKRLKLGMTFLDLHGKQKQSKRTNIFYTFLNKKNSVLFATDVAARGVDFPAVDWVLQLDCPDEMSTYIHRVGRTARYKSKGNSILFLSAKEEQFVEYLHKGNIEIKKIKINQKKLVNLQPVIRSVLSENSELLHLAQRAISSYVKSVYLQTDKKVFDISSIDIQKLALSFGLMNLPELKIVRKSQNDLKNMRKMEVEDDEYKMEQPDHEVPQEKKKKSKLEKLKEKIKLKKMQNLSQSQAAEEEPEETFLREKRKNDKEIEQVSNEIIVEPKKIQPIEDGDEEIADHYEKLKSKLSINKEADQNKEILRIHNKHKKDRLRRKELDYEKHGINLDENDEDRDDYNDLPLVEEEERTLKNAKKSIILFKLDKSKVKPISKDATIEEKERAALELLSKTNPLFA